MKEKSKIPTKEDEWAQRIAEYNIKANIAFLLIVIAFLLTYIAFKVVK